MDALRAISLLPFVQSGEEYDASRRFFKELGFEVHFIDLAGVCWHVGEKG